MKQKLISVEKNYGTKYLNFYTAKYQTDGKPRDYYFVSRNDINDLAIKNEQVKPTAIEAFTYTYDDNGEIQVVMIEEFRSAVGKYVTSFCAGLIEKDEDVNKAIEREVYEELGAEVANIELLQNYPLPMCAGMCDEANYMALVQVKNIGKQHLEETEDIKLRIYNLRDLIKKVENNEIYLTASGYLGYLVLYNYLINKEGA